MFKKTLYYTVCSIPALLLICALFAIIISSMFSYDDIIYLILKNIERQDLESIIKNKYFTISKFNSLRWILVILSFIISIMIFLQLKYQEKLKSIIGRNIDSIYKYLLLVKKHHQSLNKTTKLILYFSMLFTFFRAIYYSYNWDLQYDEAWNYNYFLDKNILYSMVAYNNYPLHNIITWVFIHLFGNSVLAIRMPVILMGIACIYVIFISIKILFNNERIALMASLLFAFLPMTAYYMLRSRGVLFEVFFALIVFFLLIYYIKHTLTFKHIIFLSILNALGTYSMLTHVYFIVLSFSGLFIFQLIFDRINLKYCFYYLFLSVFCSGMLLLPMYFCAGLSLGLNVAYSNTTYSLVAYMKHAKEYSTFITGSSYLLPLTFAVNIYLGFHYRNNRIKLFISLMNLIIILSVLIIPFFSKIFPPERALAFLSIPFIIVWILSFEIIESLIPTWLSYGSMAFTVILFSILLHFYSRFDWSKQLDADAKKIAFLLQKNNVADLYDQSNDFKYNIPAIECYYRIKKQSFRYHTTNQASTRYEKFGINQTNCLVSNFRNQEFQSPIPPPPNFTPIYWSKQYFICVRNSSMRK